MTLSTYHQKYANQSEKEIINKANEKREELALIFSEIELKTTDPVAKVAILGCGDKRFIKYHKEIFESFIRKPIEITTFDITTEHLFGENNIVKHDCTLPLPYGPYDITFAHVLLKFIETEKQWDVIKNSYDSLKPGGFAIHVLDREDYSNINVHQEDQFFVPLGELKYKLAEQKIRYLEISVRYGIALVILK